MIFLVWPLAVAAAITLFFSTAAFLVLAAIAGGILAMTAVGLKRLPKVHFEGLSSGAQKLLRDYNHAWVAPMVTKMTSSALGAWMAVLILSAAYHGYQGEVGILGLSVVSFVALSFMAGLLNPTLIIKKEGLHHEADEVRDAFVRGVSETRSRCTTIDTSDQEGGAESFFEQEVQSVEAVSKAVTSLLQLPVNAYGFSARLIRFDEECHLILGFVAASCDVHAQHLGCRPGGFASMNGTLRTFKFLFDESDVEKAMELTQLLFDRPTLEFERGRGYGQLLMNAHLKADRDAVAQVLGTVFGHIYAAHCRDLPNTNRAGSQDAAAAPRASRAMPARGGNQAEPMDLATAISLANEEGDRRTAEAATPKQTVMCSRCKKRFVFVPEPTTTNLSRCPGCGQLVWR